MLTRHIQNPAIRYYSAIIRHNQNLVQQLLTQKPGLLGILGYLKPFHKCILMHIQNPVIFTKIYKYRTLTYLKPDTYSEHSKIFRWSFFTKIFENCNYFSKVFHLRSFIRCLSVIICNSCRFRILAYLKPKIYSELCQGIFCLIQNAV